MEWFDDDLGRRVLPYHGKQFLVASAVLRGNALAFIERSASSGEPTGILPLRWDRIRPDWDPKRGLLFHYTPEGGSKAETFARRDVWHAFDQSLNGLVGLSPIAVQREAIGAGLDMQEYGSRFFRNSANPSGVLTHPAQLGGGDDEKRSAAGERLRAQFDQNYQGVDNRGRTMLLEEGMKWEAMGISPKDSDFMEGRGFNRAEIAGWFGVPLHLIGDHERGDFSIDTLSQEFVFYHLQPWLVAFEQSFRSDVIPRARRSTFCAKFNTDSLLRGKPLERAQMHNAGILGGWKTPAEARELEDLPRKEGLDRPLVPLNMGRLEEDGTVTPFAGSGQFAGPTQTPSAARSVCEEAVEVRASFDPEARPLMAASFAPQFEELGGRLVKAEEREIGKLIKQHFGRRATTDTEAFLESLAAFHAEDEDFRRLVVSRSRPVVRSLVSASARLAATEVPEGVAEDVLSQALEDLSEGATQRFARSYGLASLRGLEAAVRLAIDEGSDPSAAVRALFEKWKENRPANLAAEATVEVSRSAARRTFELGGRTLVRWRTRGKEDCPWCQRLSGKVVAIRGGRFAQKGEPLEDPAGQGKPLTPRRNVLNPPLHRGCDCDLEPA